MSRSYKKTPRSGDQKDKFFKTYANRKLRRDKFHNLQHNSYKKNFCSYDICDYEWTHYSFKRGGKMPCVDGRIGAIVITNPIQPERKRIVCGINGIK